MFVLKYKFECPELMIENFYDEVVSVRNGIALVNNEHVKNSLLLSYDYVGEITEERELNSLLEDVHNLELKLVEERIAIDLDELNEKLSQRALSRKPKVEQKQVFERIE